MVRGRAAWASPTSCIVLPRPVYSSACKHNNTHWSNGLSGKGNTHFRIIIIIIIINCLLSLARRQNWVIAGLPSASTLAACCAAHNSGWLSAPVVLEAVRPTCRCSTSTLFITFYADSPFILFINCHKVKVSVTVHLHSAPFGHLLHILKQIPV